jgi:integrase
MRTASLEPYESGTSPNRPWCVDVPPHLSPTGKRQRKFFEIKKDATTFAKTLETRQANFGHSLGSMTPARIAEASEAYVLLEPTGFGLLDAVRRFVADHKQRSASVTFKVLADKYLAEHSSLSPRHLKSLRQTRDRFSVLHGKIIAEVTHHDLEPLLTRIPGGGRNLVMRHLRAFWNFAIKRQYAVENPIDRLDFVKVEKKETEVISVDSVEKMLGDALANDLALVPILVLGFFCGVRPEGELREVQWSDISLKEKSLTIRPEVSKTAQRRVIDLSANAIAWLKAYRSKGGSVEGAVAPWEEDAYLDHRKKNRERAGVTNWPNSAMRHSFCSYWLAKHGEINKLCLFTGHDHPSTMFNHYHRLVTKVEAKKFWSIRPPRQPRVTRKRI